MSASTLNLQAICTKDSAAAVNDELEKLGHGSGTFFVPHVTQGKATDSEATHYVVYGWQCTPSEWERIKAVFERHGVQYAIQTRSDSKYFETNMRAIEAKVGAVAGSDDLASAAGIKQRIIDFGNRSLSKK